MITPLNPQYGYWIDRLQLHQTLVASWRGKFNSILCVPVLVILDVDVEFLGRPHGHYMYPLVI